MKSYNEFLIEGKKERKTRYYKFDVEHVGGKHQQIIDDLEKSGHTVHNAGYGDLGHSGDGQFMVSSKADPLSIKKKIWNHNQGMYVGHQEMKDADEFDNYL